MDEGMRHRSKLEKMSITPETWIPFVVSFIVGIPVYLFVRGVIL